MNMLMKLNNTVYMDKEDKKSIKEVLITFVIIIGIIFIAHLYNNQLF